MNYIFHVTVLLLLAVFVSCSKNDEPDNQVFVQPSSITTDDVNGANQTFQYNDYGKITEWTLKYSDNESVVARYTYTDDNTIKIESEEMFYENSTYCEETIHLINGRASKSEGTFIRKQDGIILIQKTYRMEFDYTTDNHLATVKQSEVVGIGENVPADAWNKSWDWENYLIWEDGNLKEYRDFYGKPDVYKTTKYDYSIYEVAYPVIILAVIKFLHHDPLFMQGVFGRNSNNLLKSSSVFDKDGNFDLSRQYTYEFNDDALINNYVETTLHNTAFSNSISYKVNWTAM
ncbi:MAG: hypothetical protein NC405_05460 [Odoribacter sp.]|nr:hypothetical protein [Odoribacter sp.]